MSQNQDLTQTQAEQPGGRDLIARGVITRDGAILVNRSRSAKTGEEYCALPGGHVDGGESCAHALRRELQEELGCEASVGDLLFVVENIYAGRRIEETQRHELTLFFETFLQSALTETSDGAIQSPEAGKNFGWLPLSALPQTNLLPRAAKEFLGGAAPRYVFRDDTR